jgi:aryl-alcohol dehydrogenase-like predicted oxidoreductase
MALPTRKLGRNGPQVPGIGVGLMNIGGAYSDGGSDEQRLAFLDRVYELGETFWDTADVYFDSEEIVGKWFQRSGKRNDILLATKFGLDYSTGAEVVRSGPEYAKEACERSLKRLGVDTIDLYYCHRVQREIPIEKTIEAMVELKTSVLASSLILCLVKYEFFLLTFVSLQSGQDSLSRPQ